MHICMHTYTYIHTHRYIPPHPNNVRLFQTFGPNAEQDTYEHQ